MDGDALFFTRDIGEAPRGESACVRRSPDVQRSTIPGRPAPGHSAPLRIGFIDLIDAAPLIVALEQGFFADEGLSVVLERQLGWGNIRDRLSFGQLDAAHALLGMPLFSRLGRDWFVEPLVALMNLGSGGNAITLSRRLIDAGVRSPSSLARYIQSDRRSEAMVFAHVFSCSMHHYLLREWLASGGLDPDRDVRLRVFPPNQMARHMARGYVDAFCVGEPWNTRARLEHSGEIVAVTSDIVPQHPEKILAVTRRWLERNGGASVAMIRALLRSCAYCEDERNAEALIELLARQQYLNMPDQIIRQAIAIERAGVTGTAANTSDWRSVRRFAVSATFPSRTHPAWLASQMIRWHHLPRTSDLDELTRDCCDTRAYRAAARSLEIPFPQTDSPPMPLREGGSFDPFASMGVMA
jgi:ABC-type nitrate/sulfonate/bicarbonate transport system substrate-binding protein